MGWLGQVVVYKQTGKREMAKSGWERLFSVSGLLTDQNTEQMNIVFDHAIDVANQEVGTSLTSLKEEVNYGDAYQSYGKLCRMLEVMN